MKFFLKLSIILFFAIIFILNTNANLPPNTNKDEAQNSEKDKIWLSGKIIWQGHDLFRASVQLFKDQRLKEIYTQGVLLDPEGTYTLEIEEPGTYYLVAFVDVNKNDKFDEGDGMGIYGVSDWTDLNQKPEPIVLKEGKNLFGINVEITGIVTDKGKVESLLLPSFGDINTGISGKLISPDHNFSKAIVFVYADPTWNNRIAQTKVSDTGEYSVSVPAGQYYLLAVIDENNSDLLDAGDEFGIWGMTAFGMFPKPVKVTDGNVRLNRNILIIGKIDSSGKAVPLRNNLVSQTKKTTQKTTETELKGKIVWKGHDLKNGRIQAFSDSSMTIAVAKAKTDDKGNFQLKLPDGDYYITAEVDLDGNGKYSKGDGIGVYGSEDAVNQIPKKLTVSKDLQDKDINIPITAEFEDSGQLKSMPQPKEEQTETKNEIENINFGTGISGKIIWEDHEITDVIMIFSKDSTFDTGIRVPIKLNDDGSYACSTDPGDHYIMILVDLNNNDKMDSGDGIGFYGAGYLNEGYWGEPKKVTVLNGYTTNYINISITASLDEKGKPVQTRSGIRFYYGDPDSVYNTGKNIQEWWYWSRGISFTFKKGIDNDWKTVDTYEFTPKETEFKTKSESEIKGLIYYSENKNIFVINADGSGRRWICYGENITGTFEGDKLLFLDVNNAFNFLTPNDNSVMPVNWQQEGLQPALSNDGKFVVFTKKIGEVNQIKVRNLETGEEILIPSGNLDLSYPALSPDNELLAYSAKQTQENQLNRDIYYYDLIAKRTERISLDSRDEFKPVWAPNSTRILIFCRAEGDHYQLWRVDFDAQGKPIERQITKYGGQEPSWSPYGDKIVYVNNGQLWTINPDGTDEKPILVNDQPIFGIDPFWTK